MSRDTLNAMEEFVGAVERLAAATGNNLSDDPRVRESVKALRVAAADLRHVLGNEKEDR